MKKGFTIIELLVGVALIAVISVVALKFFQVAGGGAQHIGEREKRVIDAQITAQYLLEELSSAGLAGNFQQFFMSCCTPATPPSTGCTPADCNSTQFAIKTSKISGYATDSNKVIFSSRDSSSGGCPSGFGVIYDGSTGAYKSSSSPISTGEDNSGGITTCTVNGVVKGDLVDADIKYIQYICDTTNKRLAAEIVDANSDPTAVNSFPGGGTKTVVTLIDNVQTCQIQYIFKDKTTATTYTSANSADVLGARIILGIQKSQTSASSGSGLVTKVITISRKLNTNEM